MTKIILIGGGSASGKTYVINEVLKEIGTENISHFSIDDYYKKLDLPYEERKKQNFDHPKAFDWKLLEEHIKSLKEGKNIEKPIYDYTISNRTDKTETIKAKKIVVIEGIMALVNKRIQRDQKERGRSFESIVNQYFATVLPMYEEIIGPSQYYADILIHNDKKKNHSIEVLVSILKSYL